MTDEQTEADTRIFLDQVAAYLADPEHNLVTPLVEYANTTDDPPQKLIVLTGVVLTQYAELLLEVTNNRQSAQRYVDKLIVMHELKQATEGNDHDDQNEG